MKQEVQKILGQVKDLSAEEILRYAVNRFGDRVALASSLGAEDQVLTEMLSRVAPRPRIFTLDTGRLPEETYDVIDRVYGRYNIRIKMLFPDRSKVEAMVNEHGANLFYREPALRKLCCQVRKVEPLKRELAQLDAWVTGLRREQAVTRDQVQVVEWDEGNGLIKFNPLAGWTTEEVWTYLHCNDVPYNKLHDRGYPSIGCGPCTRAVGAGEDIRAGRWWWEEPAHRECGLHLKDGKLVRREGQE